MPSNDSNDPLSADLANWRLTPRRNPQFRAIVASRIEAASAPSTWSKFARAHAPVVSAVLLGSLVVGAVGGLSEARHRSRADEQAIAANYVHSLDARWMRHP